ncbi:S8 family serine peptidase [Actinomyces sp.]
MCLLTGVGLILSAPVPARADTLVPTAEPGTGSCMTSTEYITAYAQTADKRLDLERAWGVTQGTNVTVAVVDSGISPASKHFSPVSPAMDRGQDSAHFPSGSVVLPGLDLVSPGGDGRTDNYGHGTQVAGIIAARLLPEQSVLEGVAPRVALLPVRVYDTFNEDPQKGPTGLDAAATAQGIEWAATQGAQIIVVPQSQPTQDARLDEAVASATARGSLVVASAGNADAQIIQQYGVDTVPRYPAAHPDALAVTSATGGVPDGGQVSGVHVNIAAPSISSLTTAVAGGDCLTGEANNETTGASSFATAYAAGAAALVASAHADETPAMWKWRLEATARRVSPADSTTTVGWGMVNPYAAITVAANARIEGPVNPMTGTSGTDNPPALPIAERSSGAQARMRANFTVLGIALGCATFLGCLVVLSWLRKPTSR